MKTKQPMICNNTAELNSRERKAVLAIMRRYKIAVCEVHSGPSWQSNCISNTTGFALNVQWLDRPQTYLNFWKSGRSYKAYSDEYASAFIVTNGSVKWAAKFLVFGMWVDSCGKFIITEMYKV